MQVLTVLLALAALAFGSIKHDGKEHLHRIQHRQGQGLGLLASHPPAASPAPASSVLPTISSYAFPTTVIQVPVATVCPDTPSSSAMFPILSVSSSVSVAGVNDTRGLSNGTFGNAPKQVNATAFLPNGSTIVFLSASSTAVLTSSIASSSMDTVEAETARIIMDNNGCQTVYSAKTTSWCSTTVRPAGMVPVPVTECDQWITFSSQSLDGCSTTPTAAPSSSGAAQGPVAYYLAHWYDLVQGAVPSQVQVQDCLPKATDLDCVTSSESWDVVSSTSTSTGTSVASFVGPAVITVGGLTLTTSLSFESTATTTAVVTTSAIERHRLGANTAGTSSEQTITVMVTMPSTRTFSLDSLTRTTVTVRQTSTLEVTETRTLSMSDASPRASAGTT